MNHVPRTLILTPSIGPARDWLRSVARRGRGGRGPERSPESAAPDHAEPDTASAVSAPSGLLGYEIARIQDLARDLLVFSGQPPPILLDQVEEAALLFSAADEAFNEVFPPDRASRYQEFRDSLGFRESVVGALQALRMAGVTPGDLGGTRLRDREKQGLLVAALARYERSLDDRTATDGPGVIGAAVEILRQGSSSHEDPWGIPLPWDRILLFPGLPERGLPGELIGLLRERGAREVTERESGPGDRFSSTGDPGPGSEAVPAPRSSAHSSTGSSLTGPEPAGADFGEADLAVFHAASVVDELREVLRRTLARGLCWDEVEVVTSDPEPYAGALDALATRLGIGATYGMGLPIGRTRTGRLVAAWEDWVRDGFPASSLARLIEAGDLAPPPASHPSPATSAAEAPGGPDSRPWPPPPPSPADLGRTFRSLRIGWGLARHYAALERLERPPAQETSVHEDDRDEAGRQRTSAIATRAALRDLLEGIVEPLRDTLAGPDRWGRRRDTRLTPTARISPATLARGLEAFLAAAPPPSSAADRLAREGVARRLSRVRATWVTPDLSLPAALALLRRHLDLRLPSSEGEEAAPWTASGGRIHLSDLASGGWTGRRATFVVGLDAERVGGSQGEDPLLLDGERRRISPALPLSSDLAQERRLRLDALLSRLTAGGTEQITLSWASWDPSEARGVAPSHPVLEAFRTSAGRPEAGFAELRAALGEAAGALPSSGSPPLDERDVWMGAILERSTEPDPLRETLLRHHPHLHDGLDARAARISAEATPYQSILRPRPQLDPRRTDDTSAGGTPEVLSPSRLETLGTCPRRYLLRYLLGARPPLELEADPDQWLDPAQRGALLHRVFQRLGAEVRPPEPAPSHLHRTLAREILEEEIEAALFHVPPPSDTILVQETLTLREDIEVFLSMVAEGDEADCIETEAGFGLPQGGRPPVAISLTGGGELLLRGSIDRVDDLGEQLRVVDYKTGGTRAFSRARGAHHGGRRLQNVLYAVAARVLFGRRVQVMEYHFPTLRGEAYVAPFRFDEGALRRGLEIVETLLDMVASGRFPPTDDPEDCRYCDYTVVCRVRIGEYGTVDSPPANWTKARIEEEAECVRELAEVRRS